MEQKSQTLEQRLAQLEKLLATHQTHQSTSPSTNSHLPTPPGISPLPFENMSTPNSTTNTLHQFSFASNSPGTGINPNDMFTTQPVFPDLTPPNSDTINLDTFPLFRHDGSSDQRGGGSGNANPLGGTFGWDMVSLGMQEEFPPEDLTNKLYCPVKEGLTVERRYISKKHIQCFHFYIAQGFWLDCICLLL